MDKKYGKGGKKMLAMLMAASAPGFALLSFFYLKDKLETEPVYMVLRMFVAGAFLVFPVMVLQYTFKSSIFFIPSMQAFIVTAFPEEFFKWFIVFFLAYFHYNFNLQYDGIVYAVAVSLGFATVENIFYLSIYGVEHALFRALLPVSSHALFGVIMGYYLGKAKFTSDFKLRTRYLFFSIFIPVSLHGTYNYILLQGNEWWMFTIVPFMIALWWYGLYKVKKANQAQLAQFFTPSKNEHSGTY